MLTIPEIAKLAGVSIGTVDRVVHSRGKVAPATLAKVEAVIAEYGYTPNLAARQLKQKSVLTLGALFPEPGSGSGFWDLMIEGALNAAAAFKPFDVIILPGYFNSLEEGAMLEAGRNLIKQGVNGMVLSPVRPAEALALAKDLQETPYVFVDTTVPGAKPLAVITQNPYRGGLCAGRMMKFFKPSGTFVCLRMFTEAANLRERIRGFSAYFAQDGASRVIEAQSDSYEYERAFLFMDEIFALHKDIGGIFIPHAEGHIVADYLVDRGLKEKTVLIGYDNLPANRQALLNGAIDCLIAQRPDFQGYQAVCKLYQACVLFQKEIPSLEIPIDVFFKENV